MCRATYRVKQLVQNAEFIILNATSDDRQGSWFDLMQRAVGKQHPQVLVEHAVTGLRIDSVQEAGQTAQDAHPHAALTKLFRNHSLLNHWRDFAERVTMNRWEDETPHGIYPLNTVAAVRRQAHQLTCGRPSVRVALHCQQSPLLQGRGRAHRHFDCDSVRPPRNPLGSLLGPELLLAHGQRSLVVVALGLNVRRLEGHHSREGDVLQQDHGYGAGEELLSLVFRVVVALAHRHRHFPTAQQVVQLAVQLCN